MKSYEIKENINNPKSKKRFYKDKYLNELINIIINYNGSFKLHHLVRDMFYVKSLEEYETILTKYLIIHTTYHKIIFEIYNLFTNWLPFEIYNLGELRGNYLEMLSYNYLQQHHDEKIYKESNIIINDYTSHTWDLIVELNNLHLYECKYSARLLKRNHINQMIGLNNKLPKSELFLVFYDIKEMVDFNIRKLREDTRKEKFDEIISTFTSITLDNFIFE